MLFCGIVLSQSVVRIFTVTVANRMTVQLQSCIRSFKNVWKVKKDVTCTRALLWPRPLELSSVSFTQHFLRSSQSAATSRHCGSQAACDLALLYLTHGSQTRQKGLVCHSKLNFYKPWNMEDGEKNTTILHLCLTPCGPIP